MMSHAIIPVDNLRKTRVMEWNLRSEASQRSEALRKSEISRRLGLYRCIFGLK